LLGLISNEFIRLRRHRLAEVKVSELGGRLVFVNQRLRDPRGPWWFPVVKDRMYADHEVLWFTSGKNAGLRDIDLQVLADLPRVEVIEIVAPNVGNAGIVHLAKLSRLRRLVLQDTQVTSRGLRRLKHLPIEELVMGGACVSDETLECLDSFRTLKKFAIYDCFVSDFGLGNLKHLTNLEHLYLNNCLLTDDGLRVIGELTKLKTVELLSLNIGDRAIEPLSRLRRLEQMELELPSITDQAIIPLAELPFLRYLRVFSTNVTARGLRAFEKSGSLRTLSAGPNIPADQLQAIQDIMPACEVYSTNGGIRFHGP